MICPRCGAPVTPADRFCAVCAVHLGPPPPPGLGPPPPPPGLAPPPPPVDHRPPLAGFLVSFQDAPAGKSWELRQGKNTIGRAGTGHEVDIAIPHGTVSTRQATIECGPGGFTVEDDESTAGTYIDEEAIGYGGRREVRDGDTLRLGGYRVLLVDLAHRRRGP